MTYQEATIYLNQVSLLLGSRLGLISLEHLLKELGNPQNELSYVHIAGTNGKGSILAYTSNILTAAGYKTGRYLSPAVLSEREKIQVNNQWITEQQFAACTDQIKQAVSAMERKGMESPTVFELETAIAFLHFRACDCDIVVLETGLGGDQDATNVVKHTKVAAFASISKDHMAYLGNTLTEIAQKKAGIMKDGCIAITQRQQEEVQQVLETYAQERNIPLITTQRSRITLLEETWKGQKIRWEPQQEVGLSAPQELFIPLAGEHQIENALVACQITESLNAMGYQITNKALFQGIQSTTWPGRFQCLQEAPIVIVDGAHNMDAVKHLKKLMIHHFKNRTIRLIVGVFKDKEYQQMMATMAPLACKIYTINLRQTDRTLDANILAQCARIYCPDVEACDTPQEALTKALAEASQKDIILAFGSLSYIGELITEIEKFTQVLHHGIK